MNRKERARGIDRALTVRHAKDAIFREINVGAMWSQRIDFLAIKKSWTQPCITAYEIKVDRRDLFADDKWTKYLQYCHRFYFACPQGMVKPDEIPDPAGLVVIGKTARTVKKTAYRSVDILWTVLYSIIIGRLDGLDTEENQEQARILRTRQWERWAQSKGDFRKLGEIVGHRLNEQLASLEDREREVRRKERSLPGKIEMSKRIEEIMRPVLYGSLQDNDWENKLRESVAFVMTQRAVPDINRAIEELQKVKEHMGV